MLESEEATFSYSLDSEEVTFSLYSKVRCESGKINMCHTSLDKPLSELFWALKWDT